MSVAKVQVLDAPERLRADELPLPAPTPDGALLEVEACGLCGTDLEQYKGTLPGPYPFIPGHEPVGRVVQLGERAAARWGVSEGDRVAVESLLSCGACISCRAGHPNRCRHFGASRGYGFIGAKDGPGLWGGYSTHMWLPIEAGLHRVPEGLAGDVAVWFNPLGAGIRWGVVVPQLQLGETVLVLGSGQRGLCTVIAARHAGAGTIVVTGLERDRAKLDLALHLGADFAVVVPDEDPASVLRRETGGLAHVVVDVTADAPEALAQAVACAAPGGRIVMAGTKKLGEAPGFRPDMLIFQEVSLPGVLGVDSASYATALRMIAADPAVYEELHTATLPLAQARDALERLRAGDALHMVLRP